MLERLTAANRVGFGESMPKLVFDEQGLAFMLCQENPITQVELADCLNGHQLAMSETPRWFDGQTMSGRQLKIFYKYVPWTDEFVVFKAIDGRAEGFSA